MATELSIQRDCVEATQSISRLLALDDLWTAYLDHANAEEIARDIRDLETLVQSMNDGIAVARNHVRIAGRRLEAASDDDVARAIDNLLEGHASLRDRFVGSLDEFGIRQSFVAACRYIDLEGEEEIGLLNAKLDRLCSGEFESGDISARMRCMLELAAVACSAVPCVLAFPVGCSGIGSAVLFYIARWEKSACKERLDEVMERLRAQGAEPA
jgi:hypothetical protein